MATFATLEQFSSGRNLARSFRERVRIESYFRKLFTNREMAKLTTPCIGGDSFRKGTSSHRVNSKGSITVKRMMLQLILIGKAMREVFIAYCAHYNSTYK